jgi:hypothetical protein
MSDAMLILCFWHMPQVADGVAYGSAAVTFLDDEDLRNTEPTRSTAAATLDSPYYATSRDRQLRSPSARFLRE